MRNVVRILRTLAGKRPLTMLGNWRARRESPFRHLVGAILSARSRDERTEEVTGALFRRYPTPEALAGAGRRDVEKILRPIGFYRAKTRYVTEAARRVAELGGVPRTMEGLLDLPGVGRKVAGCVLVYAFGESAIPVDTHVHRVSNRLGWVRTGDPRRTEEELRRIVPRRWWGLVNEVFVAHGKAICRPRGPRCGECTVRRWCARAGVGNTSSIR